ncbi:MAG TPA: hypothetical protein VGJ48_09650 [Pyrinomonadaceae bacterium]|jgi:hypothetical protein|nr:hypothetical protein [Pyrinomonadaceae bacterium]
MKAERWQQIEELYHSAIELRGQERAAYLEGACADDKGLRKEVERLIAAEERDDVFLIKPAMEMVARGLAANKRNNGSPDPDERKTFRLRILCQK